MPNSYETFEFTVPAGTQAGSFNVHVEWADPQNDLDVYVYRLRPDRSIVPGAITSSAAFGDNDEDAGYRPAVGNVEPDTFLVVVDNWCTSLDDPGASPELCGFTTDSPDRTTSLARSGSGPR